MIENAVAFVARHRSVVSAAVLPVPRFSTWPSTAGNSGITGPPSRLLTEARAPQGMKRGPDKRALRCGGGRSVSGFLTLLRGLGSARRRLFRRMLRAYLRWPDQCQIDKAYSTTMAIKIGARIRTGFLMFMVTGFRQCAGRSTLQQMELLQRPRDRRSPSIRLRLSNDRVCAAAGLQLRHLNDTLPVSVVESARSSVGARQHDLRNLARSIPGTQRP